MLLEIFYKHIVTFVVFFSKLKNREAAQLARDRKKQRMWELEEAIAKLESENLKLKSENLNLRKQTVSLSQENNRLKNGVKGIKDKVDITIPSSKKSEAVVVKDEPGSIESAALAVPLQKEQIRAVYEITTRFLAHLLVTRYVSISVILFLRGCIYHAHPYSLYFQLLQLLCMHAYLFMMCLFMLQ